MRNNSEFVASTSSEDRVLVYVMGRMCLSRKYEYYLDYLRLELTVSDYSYGNDFVEIFLIVYYICLDGKRGFHVLFRVYSLLILSARLERTLSFSSFHAIRYQANNNFYDLCSEE